MDCGRGAFRTPWLSHDWPKAEPISPWGGGRCLVSLASDWFRNEHVVRAALPGLEHNTKAPHLKRHHSHRRHILPDQSVQA